MESNTNRLAAGGIGAGADVSGDSFRFQDSCVLTVEIALVMLPLTYGRITLAPKGRKANSHGRKPVG